MLVSYSAFVSEPVSSGCRSVNMLVICHKRSHWNIYRVPLRHIYTAMGLPGLVSFTCKGPPPFHSYTPIMASVNSVVNFEGFYGPATATLDWCEANYQFSFYVAELVNTFSNLYSIGLAVYGVLNIIRQSLPPVYTIGFIGFATVGLGSFAFHATLLFHWQLADELPMVYVASLGCWVLYDRSPGFSFVDSRALITLFMTIAFDALFTWSYIINRNPVYHQVVFGTIASTIGVRIAYLLNWSEERFRIPDDKKAEISNVFDNIFCDPLTAWKTAVGWPLAFLFEGHAWWHIFTGTGTYFMVVGVTCNSLCMKDDHRSYTMQHPYGFPIVKYAYHKAP
ncbi:ceramidase-domain-containing protein [Desarmillaria tabescens]|uniref:Ceramidase-domain-containing protein n=1 Tax=Armillaria tabescens TaxID=1929756 RepID=A0AA39U248_ARMTA|nr:ceramidase-domain-containing protein [Desarmillaria tabescens]KAK0465540.1 ceramidase-domain-containing protein [Desarmillaria tabescens]